jgi:hypothetical protein
MFKSIKLALLAMFIFFSFPHDSLAEKGKTEDITSTLNAYIALQGGTISYRYENLETGEVLKRKENNVFRAASTIKLPLTVMVYKLALAGKIDLKQKIKYQKRHFYKGTGTIQKNKFGTLYTIRDLVERAIVHSDNIAFIMLVERVGHQKFVDYLKQLGAKHVYENGVNTASSEDLALYAKDLFAFSQKEKSASVLIKYLSHTDFLDTVQKYIAPPAIVAHKVGYLPQELIFNDVAVVYAEVPYTVVIMTKGIAYAKEKEVIATIAKLIHAYHKKKNKPLVINKEEQLLLESTTSLYDNNSIYANKIAALSKQKVTTIQRIGNWYKIKLM